MRLQTMSIRGHSSRAISAPQCRGVDAILATACQTDRICLDTFGHVHVYCTDLETTERWFVDGMGAEFVTKRESSGTPGVELRLGGQQLLLRGARDGENLAPAGARHFGTDHFGLNVQDVDAVVERLRGRGVEI